MGTRLKMQRGALWEGWHSQRELAGRFAYRCICCGALYLTKPEALVCCPKQYHHMFDVAQHKGHCRVETLVPYDTSWLVDADLQERRGWEDWSYTAIGHLPANNEAGDVWLEPGLGRTGT